MFFHLRGYSQNPVINTVIKGRITDSATRQGLSGVSIQIKGITNGTTTDQKGEFKLLTAQELPLTLVVSYVGYQSKEVLASGDLINIQLAEAANQLTEVVAIGYGTQKRTDLTGSIASVPSVVKNQPVASAERLLQGSVSGVVVTQTSGQPGGGVSVQIRGSNSINASSDPLYVIDGFPVNNSYGVTNSGVAVGPNLNPLSTLNPSDIASIDVLKDASATAIYGSRGANGVVIITTKKGSRNKSSINYDGYYGIQKVIRTLPLLNAKEWWDLREDAATNSGTTVTLPTVSGYSLDTSGEGTDWQAAAFQTAPMQSHSISILTGSEKTSIAISGNYLQQEGVIINSGYKRLSSRVNIDHQYSANFRLNASIVATRATGDIAPNSIIQGLLFTPPSLPIYQDDGSFVVNSPFETVYANPINTLYNVTNESITNRLLGNISGEYTLLPGLKAKVLLGTDIIDNKENLYYPSTTYEGASTDGNATIGSKFTADWLNENTISYQGTLGRKGHIDAVAGFTAQQSKSKGYTANSYGFSFDELTYNDLGSATTAGTPSSSASEWALSSFLGRFNYIYDSKYLLTASLRADGSSKFGEGHKWGYFPSAAAGWNISKEDFFKNVKNINNLKLRFSLGSTGNQGIDPYQSLADLETYVYNFSSTTVVGYAPSSVTNKTLSWEKTFQLDGGLDISLFNDRIAITADYYSKKTTDLLLTGTVSGTSGLADLSNNQTSTTFQNIGAIINKGFDFSITTLNIDGAVTWKTMGIFSTNTNKVLSLTPGVTEYIPSSADPSIAAVGHPIGSFIVYKTDGLIQEGETPLTPSADVAVGAQQYKDIDGDGAITTADRIIIDNKLKFTAGLTNEISYKGFTLSAFFYASVGGKIYNQNEAQLELGTGYTNGSKVMLNRWTPTNTNTDVKRAYQNPAITLADRFIESATYYRLKNISLSYSFPESVLSGARIIKSLNVYISAQNPFTWTKYSGYDPEVSRNGQTLINKGVDNAVYPNTKSYQAGLTATF
ncbi:SusC/RagA family TonB-linked outer membrane protein [Parafilimonas sp.]|uniref:SusC/RagA family TonB-linked outer membrane protein n=1 Tax=Parafilimonas sp. TaxID=1969739 RepID=UPI0039E345F7